MGDKSNSDQREEDTSTAVVPLVGEVLPAIDAEDDQILASFGLNERQRLAVLVYVTTLNARHAVSMAYPGTSKANIRVQAHRLLHAASTRKAIDALLDRHSMRKPEILARLTDLASYDPSAFVDDTGELDLAQAKRKGLMCYVRKLTTNVKRDGTRTTTVELYSRHDALMALGRARAMFKDQVQLDVDLASLTDDELARLRDGKA